MHDSGSTSVDYNYTLLTTFSQYCRYIEVLILKVYVYRLSCHIFAGN